MNDVTLTATPEQPVTIYYCKAGIQTGKTIRVHQAGKVHTTGSVALTGVNASMTHDNSTGPAKRSGARCVLITTTGNIRFNE